MVTTDHTGSLTMKRKFCQFVRTYATLDFRMDAQEQAVQARRKAARRYEVLNHTAGKVSVFQLPE